MTARGLSFASLLLAATGPAVAGEAEPAPGLTLKQALSGVSEATPATLPVTARWALSVSQGVLTAKLTLVNASNAPVDVLTARGSSPGPNVHATLDDAALSRVLNDKQEREMMSRMGPMPTYTAIAAGASREVGTYTFALPADYAGKPLRLETRVWGAEGATVTLPVEMVMGGKAGV